MTTAVIALTQESGRLVADAFDVIVTPRTLDRLRGLRIDRVAFAQSGWLLNHTERLKVMEAIATACETSASGSTVLSNLEAWNARAAKLQSEPSKEEQ